MNEADLIAALETIAEMGDKTLIADPFEDSAFRTGYSQGAHRAFAQAAAIAKSCLPQKDNGT